MSYKTILAAASGGAASNGAIELACRLGRRFGAHVEGFHVKQDVVAMLATTVGAVGMPLEAHLIDRMTADVEALASATQVAFEAAAARHDLPRFDRARGVGACSGWRVATGDGPSLVAREAMFNDLVVLGRSDRVADAPHTDAVEQALLYSGRPVLLAPAEPPATLGDNIAIGWNETPEAARALAASLPLLQGATSVSLITIDDESLNRAAAMIDHLAWHGVTARHMHLTHVHGVGSGAQLLSSARELDADLLVMGAFGHAPWREAFFGGATGEIIGVSLMPVLLSH